MSRGGNVQKLGVLPGPEGLAYLVKLNVEDLFLTGALAGSVVYVREDSDDGNFVTLKTFSEKGAREWLQRLESFGCSVQLLTMDAPKHDYVVRARDKATGEFSTHVVSKIPGWGGGAPYCIPDSGNAHWLTCHWEYADGGCSGSSRGLYQEPLQPST